MNIKVRVIDRDTVAYLRKLESNLDDYVLDGVREASDKLTYYVKGKYLNKKGINSIDRSSGEVFRSTIPIRAKKVGRDKVVGGTRIGSSAKASKYIHVHVSPRPKTTIISAKKANGYLAIPLPQATATFGVRRVNPRDLPSAKFRGRTLGTTISGNYIPYFVLKKYVTIRSKVHTKKIANEYKPKITATIDRSISRGLSK